MKERDSSDENREMHHADARCIECVVVLLSERQITAGKVIDGQRQFHEFGLPNGRADGTVRHANGNFALRRELVNDLPVAFGRIRRSGAVKRHLRLCSGVPQSEESSD